MGRERGRERKGENMTLMRGVGLVVLTPEGVRQRSDISHTVFELRSLARPCLSSEKLSVEVLLFFTMLLGSHHYTLNLDTAATKWVMLCCILYVM